MNLENRIEIQYALYRRNLRGRQVILVRASQESLRIVVSIVC